MLSSILIIDDEENWRGQFEDILKTMGYVADTASDFDEARRCLLRSDYSLILVDACLDQPSFTLACQMFFDFVRRELPRIPVIAATGKALTPTEAWTLFRLGTVVDFFYKPEIRLPDFQSRIRAVLEKTVSTPELAAAWKQRLNDLALNIRQDLDLLKDYEDELRYEDDPGRRAKLRRKIEQLRESATRYQQQYNELRAKVVGEPSTEMEGVAVELREMGDKLDMLLSEQTTLRSDIGNMLQALLSRYDASERAIVASISEHLAETQFEALQVALDALESSQLAETEMHDILNAIQKTIRGLQDQNVIVPGHDAVVSVMAAPTLGVKHKLKVTLPIIPMLLGYEGVLELSSGVDLEAAWSQLMARVRGK